MRFPRPRLQRSLLRSLALGLVFLLGASWMPLAPQAVGDEDLSPQERAKRVKEARAQLVEEERAFAERVNEAIDKGRAWLESQIPSNGQMRFASPENDPQNLGRHAMVLYTLMKCGAKAKSKPVASMLQGISAWETKMGQPGWGIKTYSASALVLAFDALHRPVAKPSRRGAKPRKPKKLPRLPRDVAARMQRWVAFLLSKQETNLWRYPGTHGPGGKEDLSHGQYVLLALHTAAERGIKVPKGVWARALPYLIKHQETSGPDVRLKIPNPAWEPGVEDRYGKFMDGMSAKARGWGYIPREGEANTGSMTTAGVACLAIIKAAMVREDLLTREQRGPIDTGLVDGLAWLQKHFAVASNPGRGEWHYYYLYGLERVGALLGQKYIGEHDWYQEGADYLLGRQTAEGGWPGGTAAATASMEGRIMNTCFALLFLRKATVPPRRALGSGGHWRLTRAPTARAAAVPEGGAPKRSGVRVTPPRLDAHGPR